MADHSSRIAIIGMAGRFPGAASIDELWRALLEGREGVRFFSREELIAGGVPAADADDPSYVPAVGFLDGADHFDAEFFGYSAREGERLDPQQRLFLECAWASVEHAGHTPDSLPSRTGVFAGVGFNTYLLNNILPQQGLLHALDPLEALVSSDKDYAALRTAFDLDLRGPAVNVQSTCSTSLVAVHLACQSLLSAECDAAIAGGSSVLFPLVQGYKYVPGTYASPDGHCRPYDRRGQGTITGSAVAAVLLKRLEDALADGDRVHAVIAGSAINNDGRRKPFFSAPSVEGQAAVLREALELAGVAPGEIGLIEGHGTGTNIGDPIETRALLDVYADPARRPASCALGSIKGNIGHTNATAGVAGLIKAALAVEHGVVPPTMHFEAPNPGTGLEGSLFFVPRVATPFPDTGGPRRAGVSAFGIGGTNAHVILEQAPERPARTPSRPAPHTVVVSARSPQALSRARTTLAAHLAAHPELDLGDVAYTTQVGRRAFAYRAAVVGRTLDEIRAGLADERPEHTAFGVVRPQPPARTKRVAFVYTGAGGEHAGMGRELYRTEPVFRRTVDRVSAVAEPLIGVPIARWIDGELTVTGELSTPFSHAAMLAIHLGLTALWRAYGVEPVAAMGHSLGEFAAACAAGVLSVEDTVRLALERARLLATRTPPGCMAVTLVPEATVRARVSAAGLGRVFIAAVNGDANTVISGEPSEVHAAMALLRVDGAEVELLRIGVASHCPLMDEAAGALREVASGFAFQAPRGPTLVSSLTGAVAGAGDMASADYWWRHLLTTVRFADALRALPALGVEAYVELGPSAALLPMMRAALGPSAEVASSLKRGADARVHFHELRGALAPPPEARRDDVYATARRWTSGGEVDFTAQHAGAARARLALPTYPFEPRRLAIDPPAAAPVAAPALERRAEVARWLYTPSWAQCTPEPADAELSRHVLVLAGPHAHALVAALASTDRTVDVAVAADAPAAPWPAGVIEHRVAAEDPAAWRALLASLRQEGRAPTRIVDAALLEPAADDAWPQARAAFARLVLLSRALLAEELLHPIQLDVLTRGLFDVVGDEPLVPERAAVIGPARVIPQELTSVTCRLVDVDAASAADLARLVVGERGAGLFARRGRHRFTLRSAPAPTAPTPPPYVRPRATVVVVGGLGGVGASLAESIAQASGDARVALIGRTALAEPRASEVRASLGRAGAEVLLLEADATDRAALDAALATVRSRWGAIHAAVHAAGAAHVFWLQDAELARADALLGSKVLGGRHLLAALAEDRPDFVLLCGSLAAVTGAPGHTDYVAANAVLAAYAHQARARHGLPVTTIDWEIWRGVGMSERMGVATALFSEVSERGIHRAAEGAEALARALSTAQPEVVVSAVDLDARVAELHAATRGGALPDAGPTGQRQRRPDIDTPFAPTEGALERDIARAWEELLGYDGLGADDRFVELGGDSLTAARLTSRLRRDLAVDLPLGAVLEAQTIRQLGAKIARIREQTTAAAPAPTAAAPAPASAAAWTDHPLSIGQERIVFFHELDPGSPAYNMSAALHLEGALEPAALAEALARVTEHHEALRTTLAREGGRTVQRVHARLTLPLEVVDRRATPLDDAAASAEAAVEARRPFELRGGPLARVRWVRYADDHGLLSLTVHHAIGDGASLAIVLEDVGRALTERAPRLSASGRFTDFAAEQRRALEAGRFEERRARVVAALAGAPEALRLPLDRPRPRVQTFRGGTVRRAVDARLTAALEQLARREGCGLFAVALAAYGALLARWSGDAEVLIGSPAANRLDERYQRTVGLFANTLVLRVAPGRASGWRALLAEASRAAQDMTAAQEVPFEALLDTLRPRADVGHLPIFQVVMFYERTPSSLMLGPARARPVAFELGTSVTDLALAVSHTPDGLRLQLDYAADLFERDTAQALLDELAAFLEALAVDADAAWRDLSTRPTRRAQSADRSPASLERALASDPSLLEAVVRARGGRRVAYVVPASPRWTPPDGWDVEAWVRLAALPLTPEGAVDEVALEAVPVLDAAVAARAEAALPAGAVAAAVIRARPRRAPLYLWDLLERPRRADASGSARADARAEAPREQGPLALLDGGPLPLTAEDPRTLVEALDRAAEGARGVAFASRGTSVEVGYAALRAAAVRVAGGLDAAGVVVGAPIILQLDDLRAHFEAFWAGALSGRPPLAVAIPPSYAEPSAAMDRLRSAWSLLDRPAVIAPRRRVAELSAGLPGARVLAFEDLAACPTDGRRAAVRPEDVLMLQLTSGSTGTSKAVEITHRAVVAHCVGSRGLFGDGPADVFLSWLSVDHVVPIVTLHLKAVFHGAAQVQAVATEILADLLAMLDLVERHRVTFTWMPNFCFKLVADKVAATPERRWDLSSLRVWLNGGEQVTLPVIQGFVDRLAPFGFPQGALRPGYGMAELATAVTYQRRYDREHVANRFLTSSLGGRLVRTDQDGAHVTTLVHVGGVAPGVQVRVADADERVLPEGYIGRVQVRGPVVTPGYRNQPEATRAARTRDDWFDTGDQGFVLDRELTISGREKELIIVRGANILPQDIEQVVAELPGVEPTSPAAVGVENERTGTEDVAVFLVPTAAGRARLPELLRQVRERVAARVGVSPAVIVPLEPAQLPRTSVGKIQRTQLKADLRRGAFDAALREVDVALESPERTVPDWFAEPVWQRRPAMPRGVRPRGEVAVITRGEPALARALAAHLTAAGDAVTVLDAATPPDASAGHSRLFYVTSASAADLDAAEECAAFARALAWLPEGRAESIVVATVGGQRVEAAEAAHPGRMALAALARTAGIERTCRAVAVDLDPRAPAIAQAAQLAAEETGWDAEVSYRGEARWVRRFRRVDVLAAPRAPLCGAGDLVLITGGAGGVGRELTAALVARGVRVAWVGRTARAALSREAIEALEGGAIRYLEADVDDEAALTSAVAALEEAHGAPLAGVLHLAGAWAQRPLAEESAATFAQAWAPKRARGVGAVLAARPRAFAVAASSVYAAFGAAGVGAYAAAGRALEALPWLEGPRRGVLRMSYWDGVGVSRGFMGHAAAALRGMERVSSARGASSVLALLDRGITAGFVGLDLTGQPWAVGEPSARDALALFAEVGDGDAPRPRQVQVEDALGRAITAPVEWRHALPRRDGAVDRALLASDAEQASAHQAPRDALERLLADVWSTALGVPSVSVRDSFFELGGHSLLAVRVLSEVSSALGRDVPVAYLFESPTIEALADRLRTHGATAWSPVVRLGAATSGTTAAPAATGAPALVLVHAGGGLVHPYEPLARALGPGVTVLGLQARGLAEGQRPHDTIAAMAAEYAEAIEREHPTGALVLGGWSLGSLVALEMTALLGERVRALALIDPIPLDTPPPAFDASDDDTLTRTARDAGLPVEQLAGLAGDALFDRFLALINASPLVGGGVGRAQLERFIAYSRAAHRAVAAYRARTTGVRTALITATRGLLDEAAVARWHKQLTGEVTRHTLAGTHESIVVGDGAAELVRALASTLG